MKVHTMEYVDLWEIPGLDNKDKDRLCSHWEADNGSYHCVDISEGLIPEDDYVMKNYREEALVYNKLIEVLRKEVPGVGAIYISVHW